MKTQIHASTLKQITTQAAVAKITLLINSLDSINYASLIRNRLNTNKGDFGRVGIIGGNVGMHGSLYLAGRAAMVCGAGRVVLAAIDNNFGFDMLMPELLMARPKDILKSIEDYDVVIVGPGMGTDQSAQKNYSKNTRASTTHKVCFDADALNILAANPQLHYQFRALPNKIITPHPKEASRLMSCEVTQIQTSRVQSIKHLSEYYNAVTVLKGYASLLYNGRELFVNPTGNPGLSNAGQGDTLCGIIGACIAQGMSLFDSLRFGVLIHGDAADQLSEKFPGLIGILATEVSKKSCELINQVVCSKK